MKRFAFPFEALGRLRRRRREALELALADVRVRRARQAAERAVLAQERQDAEVDWKATLPVRGPLDVDAAASRRAYVAVLGRRIALTDHALARTDQELEMRRLALLEAARAEKVVERLRERRHEEWVLQGSREEQSAFDEAGLVLQRGGRP